MFTLAYSSKHGLILKKSLSIEDLAISISLMKAFILLKVMKPPIPTEIKVHNVTELKVLQGTYLKSDPSTPAPVIAQHIYNPIVVEKHIAIKTPKIPVYELYA